MYFSVSVHTWNFMLLILVGGGLYILVRISTNTSQILTEISDLIQYDLGAQIRNCFQVTYTGCSS